MSDATNTELPVEPLVLSRREGALTRITLNRPRAINAVTTDMVVSIREALSAAHTDGSTAVLLDGAGDRGFCGGGDVKAMVAGGAAGAQKFLWEEYRTDHAIHASRVPVVGIMDGITMGGGIGLTGHAAVRVVTERSRLAMPETRIGIVPDVGANVLLAGAAGHLGSMLAAASSSMTAGDAIALGFADFYVHSSRIDELRTRLAQGEDPRDAAAAVSEEAPASPLVATAEWFTEIAEVALGSVAQTLSDPKAVALKLIAALEASALEPARALAAEIRGVCPTSVVVALAQVARARAENLGVAEALIDDYRVLGRMFLRADFAEGARAQPIDKDGQPRWSPASLEEVDAAEVSRILDPNLVEGERALKF